MVARDHNRSDPCFPTFVNCCLYLRTHRIDHAAQSQKAKLPLQQIRILAFRLFRPDSLSACQHTQCPICHGLICLQNLFPIFFRHGQKLSILQIKPTTGENHIRRPFCKLNIIVLAFMDRGHHFSSGIKGSLQHTGHTLF